MRLLLFSNGAELHAGAPAPTGWLREHLDGARRVLFVPFAGVTIAWDDYAARVRGTFGALGLEVVSAHEVEDPVAAVGEADAIVIGGGNTFHLLRALYERELLEPIRQRVAAGAPYVGWSAGANVACPTIRTTNDMPIVEPPGLAALGLVPFQINPHYTDARLDGHGGETRAERLQEFVAANPQTLVVGLPEGTALRVEGETVVERLGPHPVRLFEHGQEPRETAETDLGFLMVTNGW